MKLFATTWIGFSDQLNKIAISALGLLWQKLPNLHYW